MSQRQPPRGVNLHPGNHTPKALKQHNFDVIVIGSGPVGRALGAQTAASGLSTVVVESELVGGDCPNWACVPSKALLRPGETLAASRQVSGAKELIAKEPKVDVDGVFSRRDRFTQEWDDQWLVDMTLSQKCSLVRGQGKLVAEKKVIVKNINGEEVTITANHAVVLATGSDPIIPPIPGLSEIPYWTPREATSSNQVPAHLIILGAGAVGTEMATAYSGYGGRVSLISSSSEILPRQEPQASKMVREALHAAGVYMYLGVKVEKVSSKGHGQISVGLSNGKTIDGSTLLIATGRVPRVKDLGLELLGISTSLALDPCLSVKTPRGEWLYAIGDTNNISPTTHMGSYQARIAANAIIARANPGSQVDAKPWGSCANTASDMAVAQVIFTDPNIAHVGFTAAEAKKRGMQVRSVEVSFSFPGAWLHAEFNYEGWAQWVIDVQKNTLVGATFVGREAADLVHASTVAIVGEIPVHRLLHAVPSFPTVSEVYTMLYAAT